MPAMWDRLQQRATTFPILPQPRLQPQNHRQRLARIETDSLPSSPAEIHGYHEFDSRLNALGIASEPFRYEIRKGKTVPQPVPVPGEISPPPEIDDDALPFRELPPRNPLRLRSHHQQPQPQPRPQHQHQNDPAWRPASSIYPDDDFENDRHEEPVHQRYSPAIAHLKVAARNMYGRPALEQISPPSSPDVSAVRDGHMAGDVSPIDEDMDMSQQQLMRGVRRTQPTPTPTPSAPQQHKSSIPTMRRERRRQQDVTQPAARDVRPKEKAARERQNVIPPRPDSRADANRWDAPGEPPFAVSRSSTPDGEPLGLSTTITGPQVPRSSNNSPSFGQRVRQLGRSKPEPLESRPAWNGASGRTALVQPVRDEPVVAPLNVPAKNNKRGGRKISAPFASTLSPVSPSGSETSSGAASAARRMLLSRSEQKPTHTVKTPSPPVPAPATRTAGAQSYPSPPHVDSPIRAPHAPAEPARTSPAPLLTPETVPSATKAIKRKPPPAAHANSASHGPHPSTSSSIYSSYPDPTASAGSAYAAQVASLNNSPAVNDNWVQPGSRFSITTYATSNADSPRQSLDEDRPPMPTPPQQLASVMDRRRPLPAGESAQANPIDPVVISMKSAYVSGLNRDKIQPSHFRGTESVDMANRPISIMSTSKALPLAPPEMLSVDDRVAHLNARLENLAHRRNNINRSIKQMTELMPTDNLMASAEVMHKREVEKRKVEGLREELSEVQQEEYDLGLKLHRAYKRLDKDQEYEPTTLWVRRITN